MVDELITLETAKLAKEKGFDLEFCNTGWHGDFGDLEADNYPFLGTYSYCTSIYCNNKVEYQIQCSTQSLLQKWLREVHNIHVYVTPESISKENETYFFHIWGDEVRQHFRGVFGKNYEETLEFGLQEALKLIEK